MEIRQLAHRRYFALALGLGWGALLATTAAEAVGTRRLVLEQGSDFKGGDLAGVAIDSSGRVRAGLELGHITIDQAPVIWSVLARDDRSLLIGTGQEGKLLEYRGDHVVAPHETGGLVVTS